MKPNSKLVIRAEQLTLHYKLLNNALRYRTLYPYFKHLILVDTKYIAYMYIANSLMYCDMKHLIYAANN